MGKLNKINDNCSKKQPVWLLYTVFGICAGAIVFAILHTAVQHEKSKNNSGNPVENELLK